MINTKYPTTKPSLNLDFANTKSLDPRITFRRGTPGTYYDGVTHAKAEENLLSYSEDISNADWVKNESTVSSNSIAAPDGNTTADKIVESNQAGNHSVYQIANLSSTTSQFVFSVYAKAGERSVLSLNGNRTAFFSVLFDLTNGSFVSKFESNCRIDSYSIVDAGNQWFRCSVVVSPAFSDTSPRLNLSVADSNVPGFDSVYRPTYTGDGSSGLYVWGAQLEQRDSVTAYTSTMLEGGASAPITKYQPKLMTASADHARFDHDPITGESKGLLIEEQRTNLIPYSEDFSQWENLDSATDKNVAIAPNGGLVASKLIPDSTNSPNHRTKLAGISCTAGTNYTFSCFLKKDGKDFVDLRFFDDSTNAFRAVFDLSNGTVAKTYTGTETKIEDRGNGWYYCAVSGSATVTRSNGVVLIYAENGSEGPSYSGNGYDGVLIWGAQFEVGSFATSYIKTTGASATRSADNASITGENFSSWYRQDEGSFQIDASLLSTSTNQTGRFITISDGSSGNKIQIDNNNTTLNFNIVTRSANQGSYTWNRGAVLDYKFAFGLKKDNVAFCKNNESVAVDSSVELFTANRLDIKNENSFAEQLNGHIKKLAYYPQRLTNEQLQNLTK